MCVCVCVKNSGSYGVCVAAPRAAAVLAPCPLCGGRELRRLCRVTTWKTPFDVVRCRGCTLLHVNPRPGRAALDALYDLGPDYGDRYPEAIRAVTAEDVLRVARRVIDLDRCVTATIRP